MGQRVDPEIARQELERRKGRESFAYFTDAFAYMFLKEGGDPAPFKLWDFQKDAADKFQKKQKIIVLKARQMGMSWLAMTYVVWRILYTKNFHVYITSIGLKEVQEQMERIRFIWYNLPEHITKGVELGGKNCKDNDSLIEFTNGSAIHAIASSRSGGHGAAPGLYVLDEFARKDNDLMAWRAIKPSLGSKSQVIMISTSDGFNNLFAELWFDAVSKSNDFTPIFYSASEHPEYTEEYLAEQKRDFAGDLEGYNQAFPMTPEDAFMASSHTVFDIERIREWKEYIRENDMIPEVGKIEIADDESRFWTPDDRGNMLIWKHPEEGHMYTMGVDLAEGLLHGDWSVTAVLDYDTNEIVALLRGKIAPEYYSYPVLNIAKYYNNAWIVIEVNKNAETIVGDLKTQYPWLYKRTVREKITDIGTQVIGFISGATSKPRIITQMRRAFSDEEKPLKVYSDIILDEMAVFEETKTYKLEAKSGYHDDCVIAVALAIEGVSTMPTQRPGTGRSQRDQRMDFSFDTRQRSWRSL